MKSAPGATAAACAGWRFPAGAPAHCTHCGVCVGVCPTRALELDGRKYPFPARPEACAACGLCGRVCPGREIDFAGLLGRRGEGAYDPLLGPVLRAVLAWDARPGASVLSSSGGAVTALARFALSSGRVEAVCGTAPDPRDPTRFVPVLVTGPGGLEAGRQAKYQVIPVGTLLRELSSFRRVAFVGPGCQVAGVRKAQRLVPGLEEKISCVIGFFCSTGNLDYAATEFMLRKGCGCAPADVERLEYRHGPYPGAFRASLRGGGERLIPKDDYKWLYALHTEPRCMACVDLSAELADLSFGDPFRECARPEGQSAGIVRTAAGDALLRAAGEAGEVGVREIERGRIAGAQRFQFAVSRGLIPRRNRRLGRVRFDLPAAAGGAKGGGGARGIVLFSVFRFRRAVRRCFDVLPFGVFAWLSRHTGRS